MTLLHHLFTVPDLQVKRLMGSAIARIMIAAAGVIPHPDSL
jgi:hypothetical protein